MLIASGRRSGEMISTELDSFEIGTGPSCLVQSSCTDVHSTGAGGRVRVARRAGGWVAEPVSGASFFLGQKIVTGAVKLRSGDLIRLGHRGDDFQFRLQTSARTIDEVFSAHLPEQSSVAEEAEHSVVSDRKTIMIGGGSLSGSVRGPAKSSSAKSSPLKSSPVKSWARLGKETVPPVFAIVAAVVFVVVLAVIMLLVFLVLNRSGGS